MYAKTTTVSVAKTRAAIDHVLHKAGAKQYGTAIDTERHSARVEFALAQRLVRFVVPLPAPSQFTSRVAYEQRERQRWRGLLLVIKAKLEAVESRIETFDEAFLAQIVLPNNATVGDTLKPAITEAYGTGRMPRLLLAENASA